MKDINAGCKKHFHATMNIADIHFTLPNKSDDIPKVQTLLDSNQHQPENSRQNKLADTDATNKDPQRPENPISDNTQYNNLTRMVRRQSNSITAATGR